MQDVNSPGRAQPHSSKSINLEANILSEWSATSMVLHQQLRIRILALGGVLLFASVAIPALSSVASNAGATATAAKSRFAMDAKAISVLEQQSKAAEPQVQIERRLAESRLNLQALLGNLVLVIDSVPNDVAFDTVQAEIIDAQLTITCKSQAESADAGAAFAAAASKGPNILYAVQASTMKSEALGPNGVAFDFIKRVNLEP